MSRSPILTLVALVVLGGAAWMLFSDKQERLTGPSPTGAEQPETDTTVSGRPQSREGKTQARSEAAGAIERPPDEDARTTFVEGIAMYAEAVAEDLAARAVKDDSRSAEATREQRREAFRAQRTPLVRALRADQQLATELLAQIDAQQDPDVALALARLLRFVDDATFTPQLQKRATGGTRPVDRKVGLLALESRPYEAWNEPLTHAFEQDTDGDVRDTAAEILSRQMVDRRYVQEHKHLRATAVAALDAADPDQRVRGLRVLLVDWTPQAETQRGRIEALHQSDPSDKVREEAGRVLRVWDQQMPRKKRRS